MRRTLPPAVALGLQGGPVHAQDAAQTEQDLDADTAVSARRSAGSRPTVKEERT